VDVAQFQACRLGCSAKTRDTYLTWLSLSSSQAGFDSWFADP
jgi:hypothetical protein